MGVYDDGANFKLTSCDWCDHMTHTHTHKHAPIETGVKTPQKRSKKESKRPTKFIDASLPTNDDIEPQRIKKK